MSLCNLTIQYLESRGHHFTGVCPAPGCGLPVARHTNESAPPKRAQAGKFTTECEMFYAYLNLCVQWQVGNFCLRGTNSSVPDTITLSDEIELFADPSTPASR